MDAFEAGRGEARSPLIHVITVPVDAGRAFEAFTSELALWWDPRLTADAATFCGVRLDPDHPTTLGADFAQDGATGTRLTLTHGGWGPDNVAERAKFNEWPALLERYRSHLQPAL